MTTVQTKSDGRIVTTIPIKYARNLPSPKGTHLSWHVRSRDRLEARPEGHDPPEQGKTTIIQHNSAASQYSVHIPPALAHAMHMIDAELEWDFDSGNYVIDIVSRGDDA